MVTEEERAKRIYVGDIIEIRNKTAWELSILPRGEGKPLRLPKGGSIMGFVCKKTRHSEMDWCYETHKIIPFLFFVYEILIGDNLFAFSSNDQKNRFTFTLLQRGESFEKKVQERLAKKREKNNKEDP